MARSGVMAGGRTAYLCAKLLDHALGGPTFVPPAKLYAALSVQAFNETATGAHMHEVVAGDYARVEVDNSAAVFSAASAASPSKKHNVDVITWPAALVGWATPLCVYLTDAPSGGNALFGADIDDPESIHAGDAPTLIAGDLVIGGAGT